MPNVMDAACDLSEFTDTECTRYALGAVKWDAETGVFAATDAIVLAIVPAVKVEETEKPLPAESVLIPARLIVSALGDTAERVRRNEGDRRIDVVAKDGRVSLTSTFYDGFSSHSDLSPEGKFPEFKKILPRTDAKMIWLDPAHLCAIAEYAEKHSDEECKYGMAILVDRSDDETIPVEFVVPVGEGRAAHFVLATKDPEGFVVQRAHEKWGCPA